MTDKKKNDGLLKKGTSARARAGRKAGTPRIMLVALVVAIVGAAALFWPRGGSTPSGIGEHQTIVTAPETVDTEAPQNNAVRSGDVDIEKDTPAIVPEQPEGQAVDKSTQPKIAAEKPKSTPKPTPKKTTPPPPKPKADPVKPGSSGAYAIQIGAFGTAENADKEAARLQDKGWPSRVRAGNNSDGEMVFRVWIGYFKSRQEAQTFVAQNPEFKSAIPVHR